MIELISLIEELRTQGEPPNEEAMKNTLLLRIIRAVGWNTYDTAEVSYEHSVGHHKAGGRVDLALCDSSSNRVLALIEAKSPREKLDTHIEQVLQYAYHEGCDICVLTNGVEWWFFLPREAGRFRDRWFAALNLNTTPKEQLAEDFETFLGKENLVSGKTAHQAKRVLEANQRKAKLKQKTPEIWQNMMSQPDEELVELVIKQVYEQIGLRPEKDQVKAILQGRLTTTRSTRNGHATQRTHTTTRKEPLTTGKLRLKPTVIKVLSETHTVATWQTAIKEVLSTLYRRHPHEYDRALQDNWGGLKGVISTDPRYRLSFRPPGARFYLSTNFNSYILCERLGQLLHALGRADTDLQYQVRVVKSSTVDVNHTRDDFQTRVEGRWFDNSEMIEILREALG